MMITCGTCHKHTVCYVFRFFYKITGLADRLGLVKKGTVADAFKALCKFGEFCSLWEEMDPTVNYDMLYPI